jgi:hypothetical protein
MRAGAYKAGRDMDYPQIKYNGGVMSVQIAEKKVIMYIIRQAQAFGIAQNWPIIISDVSATREPMKLAKMLEDQNRAAYASRYSVLVDASDSRITFRPQEFYDHPSQFDKKDAVQTIKTCDYYLYNSSESSGWKESQAKRFVDYVRIQAITSLDGYDEAVWGAPE